MAGRKVVTKRQKVTDITKDSLIQVSRLTAEACLHRLTFKGAQPPMAGI